MKIALLIIAIYGLSTPTAHCNDGIGGGFDSFADGYLKGTQMREARERRKQARRQRELDEQQLELNRQQLEINRQKLEKDQEPDPKQE
jgi:hypothetical protein